MIYNDVIPPLPALRPCKNHSKSLIIVYVYYFHGQYTIIRDEKPSVSGTKINVALEIIIIRWPTAVSELANMIEKISSFKSPWQKTASRMISVWRLGAELPQL